MTTIDDLLRRAYSSWDDAAVLAETGRELHDRNRLADAKRVLARALEIDAADPETWAYLGYCHLRGYEEEKGVEILRAGIAATGADHLRAALANFTPDDAEKKALTEQAARSDDPVVRAELAWNRVWAGDAAAADDVRAIAAAHPGSVRVRDVLLWALGDVKRRGGEIDLRAEAVPLADRKIAEEPDRYSGYWHRTQLMVLEKDWDGVLETTARALERFPDEETSMYFRGRAFREKGDLLRAVQCFSRAIGMKPGFAGARVELGKTYEALGEIEAAEEVFAEIQKANPGYPGGPVGLALFLARRERWDEAVDLLAGAWPKLPKWLRDGLKKNPEAAALLERAAVE